MCHSVHNRPRKGIRDSWLRLPAHANQSICSNMIISHCRTLSQLGNGSKLAGVTPNLTGR
jgi:hypothetical protein